MQLPTRTKKYVWTVHSKYKMRQYGLSEQRVKNVIHAPKRIETGVAEGTIAFLQTSGSKAHPHEIWVMVVDAGKERRVISAWRYPGETKPGEPLPESIVAELGELQ